MCKLLFYTDCLLLNEVILPIMCKNAFAIQPTVADILNFKLQFRAIVTNCALSM